MSNQHTAMTFERLIRGMTGRAPTRERVISAERTDHSDQENLDTPESSESQKAASKADESTLWAQSLRKPVDTSQLTEPARDERSRSSEPSERPAESIARISPFQGQGEASSEPGEFSTDGAERFQNVASLAAAFGGEDERAAKVEERLEPDAELESSADDASAESEAAPDSREWFAIEDEFEDSRAEADVEAPSEDVRAEAEDERLDVWEDDGLDWMDDFPADFEGAEEAPPEEARRTDASETYRCASQNKLSLPLGRVPVVSMNLAVGDVCLDRDNDGIDHRRKDWFRDDRPSVRTNTVEDEYDGEADDSAEEPHDGDEHDSGFEEAPATRAGGVDASILRQDARRRGDRDQAEDDAELRHPDEPKADSEVGEDETDRSSVVESELPPAIVIDARVFFDFHFEIPRLKSDIASRLGRSGLGADSIELGRGDEDHDRGPYQWLSETPVGRASIYAWWLEIAREREEGPEEAAREHAPECDSSEGEQVSDGFASPSSPEKVIRWRTLREVQAARHDEPVWHPPSYISDLEFDVRLSWEVGPDALIDEPGAVRLALYGRSPVVEKKLLSALTWGTESTEPEADETGESAHSEVDETPSQLVGVDQRTKGALVLVGSVEGSRHSVSSDSPDVFTEDPAALLTTEAAGAVRLPGGAVLLRDPPVGWADELVENGPNASLELVEEELQVEVAAESPDIEEQSEAVVLAENPDADSDVQVEDSGFEIAADVDEEALKPLAAADATEAKEESESVQSVPSAQVEREVTQPSENEQEQDDDVALDFSDISLGGEELTDESSWVETDDETSQILTAQSSEYELEGSGSASDSEASGSSGSKSRPIAQLEFSGDRLREQLAEAFATSSEKIADGASSSKTADEPREGLRGSLPRPGEAERSQNENSEFLAKIDLKKITSDAMDDSRNTAEKQSARRSRPLASSNEGSRDAARGLEEETAETSGQSDKPGNLHEKSPDVAGAEIAKSRTDLGHTASKSGDKPRSEGPKRDKKSRRKFMKGFGAAAKKRHARAASPAKSVKEPSRTDAKSVPGAQIIKPAGAFGKKSERKSEEIQESSESSWSKPSKTDSGSASDWSRPSGLIRKGRKSKKSNWKRIRSGSARVISSSASPDTSNGSSTSSSGSSADWYDDSGRTGRGSSTSPGVRSAMTRKVDYGDIKGGKEHQQTLRVPVLSNLGQIGGDAEQSGELQQSQNEILQLYRDFIVSLRRCGLTNGSPSFKTFEKRVRRQRERIKNRHKVDSLKMFIKVTEGKPIISIKPA